MAINPNSWFWRHVQKGGLESIGWDVQVRTAAERTAAKGAGKTGFDARFKNNGFMGWRAVQESWMTKRAAGMGVARSGISALGKAIVPAIGLGFTAWQIKQGWEEGGAWGAIKEGGFAVGGNIAFSMLVSSSIAGATTGGLAIAGMGTRMVGMAAREKSKRIRGLELATVGADVLHSQGATTERQRAAEALQNTRINARMALGNEASLFHTRYR